MTLKLLHLLLLVQLWLNVSTTLAKTPAIIVFGDSSVDSGNNNYVQTIVKSNFQPYGRDFNGGVATGRFSNGRLATDFISEYFGLPPTVPAYLNPDFGTQNFASGVCFASAGTGYDNATSDVLSVIPLWKELEYYKEYHSKLKSFQGEAKAQETFSQALYIISLGTNDFLENYFVMPTRSSVFTVEEYEDFLVGIAEGFINEIYQLGARKINLAGLPPMGCLPLERVTNFREAADCREDYNKVAYDFNSKLQGLLGKLGHELPDAKLVYSNLYDIFAQVIAAPSSYGFEDALTGCCSTGLFEMGYLCDRSPITCRDANKYVFWDAFHPSERMNLIIADYLMNTTLYVYL